MKKRPATGKITLSLCCMALLVLSLFFPQSLQAQDTPPSKTVPESTSKAYLFRFLIVPGKTRALIHSVKVVDGNGKAAAFLNVGADEDQSGPGYVVINNENQWGEKKMVDALSCRGVNEGNGKSQHSSFALTLDRQAPSQKYKIIIKYKDDGDDLVPLEISDGQEFRRIGQILLENSGGWLEETFVLSSGLLK